MILITFYDVNGDMLTLMCLENKQILQGAEEVHSQFPDLLQARSGSKEDYTTSHFSRLY